MRQLSFFAVLLAASPAFAHVGAAVANAQFTTPPDIPTTMVDGGVTVAPFNFDTADQSYTLSWTGGNNDPTGRFFFYYWDHQPTYGVQPDEIEMYAKPVSEKNNPLVPVAIYAGCTCNDDQGVICADLSGMTRDCRTSFAWDTSQVPTGAYWVIAVNRDPPFHVYSVSHSPVLVVHPGDQTPPAVAVVRPDGFGSWDTSYHVQWLASGTPPLKFDLQWGDDNAFGDTSEAPLMPLASGIMPALGSDGTYAYDWDISGLASLGQFFVQITVTDGNGVKSFTQSKFGVGVFHPSGVQPDMAMSIDGGGVIDVPPPKKDGCSFDGGGATAVPFGFVVLTLLLAARLSRKQS